MKNFKKNVKGITLLTLIITIVVLLILASIATYSGIDVINSSKFTKFTTEMKIMQTQVNALYEKYKNGETVEIGDTSYEGESILTIGKEVSTVQTQANIALNASGITDKSRYRYFDEYTIKGLNIEGVDEEFFVNIATRSVVSYKGFEYEGKTYYTLKQLPNGLYNVDYEENINTGAPTFDTDVEKIGENKWKITISNIQYGGYIDKWEVKYKLSSQENWNTSKDLSFVVNEEGIYNIKIVNGNTESQEKNRVIYEEGYVTEGIILYFDGIRNTRAGHDDNATVWEDLSGNNNDAVLYGDNTYYYENGYITGNTSKTDLSCYICQPSEEIKFDNTESFSFELVFNRITYNEDGCIFGTYSSGNAQNEMWSNSVNSFNMRFLNCRFPQSGAYSITMTKPISVTCTYDANEQVMKYYINSVLVGEYTTVSSSQRYGVTLGIRKQATGSHSKFYATRYYNRVLTENEVKYNYGIDKERFDIEESE